jgi:glycosyltransferase involved in cell wall biosynthesis
MRVMQVLTQGHGGPADHVADLSGELVRSGHEVAVLAPESAERTLSLPPEVQLLRFPVDSTSGLKGLFAVWRAARGWRPDVIHLQDRRSGLLGRLAVAVTRMPSVYTLHGAPDRLAHLVPNNARAAQPQRGDRLKYLTIERWLARLSSSRVVVASHALKTYATDAIGLPAHRLDVIPNGIRIHDFVPHVPAGETAAVWLGLMVDIKRLDVLIDAMVTTHGPHLEVVGDGPLRAEVVAQVERLDVSDRVSLAGFQADPRAWLSRANVAVLTSDAENCPLALLQAMASGCAIVATSVGGVPEIVRHEQEGLLVPPGDPEAVSDALMRLSRDVDLRARLAKAALVRVKDFTVQDMTQRMIVTYRRVMGDCP